MRRIAITGSLVLGLALGAAGGARAGEGTALIQRVDVEHATVVLDRDAYRVSDRTRIHDADGNVLTLAQLPSLERGASADAAAAWFEAGDGRFGSAPPLYELRLTGAVPK
jgi:hypothetical protein